MIKTIRVTGFKSLQDVTVHLEPITVFIGRSGSGKTNFVQALRWLREALLRRSPANAAEIFGGWRIIEPATATQAPHLSFEITLNVPGIQQDVSYRLGLEYNEAHRESFRQAAPSYVNEKLVIGTKTVFHHERGQWRSPPPVVNPPQPAQVMLGSLTGFPEASVVYQTLAHGIGCYSFPDSVLTVGSNQQQPVPKGLVDDGSNYLETFVSISQDLKTWLRLQEIAATMRRLKPSLKNVDLLVPSQNGIVITHELDSIRLPLSLSRESEGFRRLFACLLALYQTPSKEVLIFDEPEKGIYPAALELLAEEFERCAEQGRGQVILTTHSPDFLDHFSAQEIRVVEMERYTTRIGPVSAEQQESLREKFLQPGELLTVDPARIAEPAAKE